MENIWVGISSIQRSPYFLRSKRWWADSTKKNTEIRNGWESKSLCAFLHQLPFLSSQFPWSCMSQVAVFVMLPFIMSMTYQPFLLVYWFLTSVFSAQSESKLLTHPTANTHTFMLICTDTSSFPFWGKLALSWFILCQLQVCQNSWTKIKYMAEIKVRAKS